MEKEKEHMRIVIAGHVDHGKSTLIGRLFFDTDSLPEGKLEELKKTCEAMGRELEFCFLMDSLEEERDQTITIDTTQAFFKTRRRNYVIIDAPGHKEFLRNMITGASLAEAAILIVDASSGVQEQTKRHAYILSLLGLQQVIVALNKMDLVEYRQTSFEKVKKELLGFLAGIDIKPRFIVPISAKQGDNVAKKSSSMPWYDGPSILRSLDSFDVKKIDSSGQMRFPVQDVYHVDGKRIIVGRVESGAIKQGDTIVLLPNNTETKVKSIELFLKPEKQQAFAGESIGVTTTEPIFVDRGNVICKRGQLANASNQFEANVFWLGRQPVALNERLLFRCATQQVGCVIKEIKKKYDSSSLALLESNAQCLNSTEVGEVVLLADSTIVFDSFNQIEAMGRFVLEKGMDAVAGGIITK